MPADRPALAIQILIPRDPVTEADGVRTRADAELNHDSSDAHRGQNRVVGDRRRPRPNELAPTPQMEGSIVEHHEQRNYDGDFFARESRDTTGDTERAPSRSSVRTLCVPAADGRVQCSETKQRAQNFCSLHRVQNGFGVKRVDQPDRRDSDGNAIRYAMPILELRKAQCSSNECEKQTCSREVQEEIEEMV